MVVIAVETIFGLLENGCDRGKLTFGLPENGCDRGRNHFRVTGEGFWLGYLGRVFFSRKSGNHANLSLFLGFTWGLTRIWESHEFTFSLPWRDWRDWRALYLGSSHSTALCFRNASHLAVFARFAYVLEGTLNVSLLCNAYEKRLRRNSYYDTTSLSFFQSRFTVS